MKREENIRSVTIHNKREISKYGYGAINKKFTETELDCLASIVARRDTISIVARRDTILFKARFVPKMLSIYTMRGEIDKFTRCEKDHFTRGEIYTSHLSN